MEWLQLTCPTSPCPCRDKWNKLDFVLVLLSLLDLAVTFMHATFVRVLRVLRVQRLLRLVRVLRFVRFFRDSKV